MRATTSVLTILAAWCGAALGDQITLRNIPYPNVQVTDAGNCQIAYQLSGRTYRRPIADANAIHLDGQVDFTRAEKHAAAAKDPKLAEAAKAAELAKAVAAYDKAMGYEGAEPWHKRLIRYRRVLALDATGQVGRAVEDWLAIVDESTATRPPLAFCPTRSAERGSPENARAIRLLEERLKAAKEPALLARIKELLTELYTVENLTDRLAALTGGPAATNGTGGAPAVEPTAMTVSAGALSAQLQKAADLFNAGQYAAAAAAINLRSFGAQELPAALLLRGKALLVLYEKGPSAKRQALAEAGLCFMRAACCPQGTSEAPEATFLAARVCEHLGNPVAAKNAYGFLVERHPDTEWAQKAQAALEAGK